VRHDDSRDRDNAKSSADKGQDVSLPLIPEIRRKFNRALQSVKPAQSTAQTEEQKKAERLAKLEAWKKKQAEERERKQKELAAGGGARSLLDEIDKHAARSSATASPLSPSTPNGDNSPTPYAGKFDPKAIAKKASTNSAGAPTLGTDVLVPERTKQPTASASLIAGVQADAKPSPLSKSSTGRSSFSSKEELLLMHIFFQ
jgi:ATP-dependent RNA helicase DDX46/PRP5